MSQKAKISFFGLTLVTLLILGLFNNCQPMQPLGYSSDDSSNGPTGGGAAAVAYFNNTVVPALQLHCATCHVSKPLDVGPGGVFAPDLIYKYSVIQPRVLQGPSATNNPFYNKLRAVVAHTGGDRCVGDLDGSTSPCREVKAWAQLENPLFAEGAAGGITYVTSLGEVVGYAINPKAPTAQINIYAFVGGPVGTGTEVATVLANLPGSGTANGHTFRFTLPPTFRDGTVRQLYIYGMSATTANLIPAMPYSYTAYTPSPEGMAHYAANVQPKLNTACAGCHTWDYAGAYARLTMPLPNAGGTNLNNTLINKMSASVAHGGGNRCNGGKNAEPCASVRNWFDLEFN